MTSTSSLPGTKIAGMVAVKVVPRPGSLVTPTSPPSSVARRLQIDRPRPEPRSSPTSPGRAELDELLEDARVVGGVEARAGVRDGEADLLAGVDRHGRDADLAALGELQAVDHVVAQDLRELEGVGAQGGHAVEVLEDDRHAG